MIRTGDIYAGFDLAKQSHSASLQRDCAYLFEDMKVYDKAAELFLSSGLSDKAAGIYITMRNFAQADPIMPQVSSPALHKAYAEAKEEEGKYEVAEKSYLIANEIESVIRLYLKTKKEELAFALVRETKHQEGSKMVAEYCISKGKPELAIEFLLLARLQEEAFQLAVDHNSVHLYSRVLEGKGSPAQYEQIAKYYEESGDFLEAGKWYAQSGNYGKAVNILINTPSGDQAIITAIDVVGRARDDKLTTKVLEFLMGENDGKPKDPNFVFRLYFSLGNYLQAARTAIIIATTEQETGKYTIARTILYDAHNMLRTKGIKIIPELKRNFVLIHSYFLAKLHIKLKRHENAARMMSRVASNISRFPSQTGPILITAVLECQKAGLKKDAWEFARILSSPEYRPIVPEKYRTKIDAIVRRADKKQEDEAVTPCPVCSSLLAVSSLECSVCRNYLPACVLTGYHMVIDDWCQTPCCNFPVLYSEMKNYCANNQSECPLCSAQINPLHIIREANTKPLLEKGIETVEIHSLNDSGKNKKQTSKVNPL
jgi:WD repeat-containing protein 19